MAAQIVNEQFAGRRPLVAVDLCPAAPGGLNGGIKVFVDELVRELPRVAPDLDFVLLSKERQTVQGHRSSFEHCAIGRIDQEAARSGALRAVSAFESLKSAKEHALAAGRAIASRVLPQRNYSEAVSALREYTQRGLLKKFEELRPDLVFCPFASQFFAGRGVPSVALIADLQHRYLPAFFSRPERLSREREFSRACQSADRLIAISNWTRRTVLETKPDLPPARIEVIHIGLPSRPMPPTGQIADVVRRLGLEMNGFLLYPANFWAHKNHTRAVEAFGRFVGSEPDSTIKLVLTGADTGCQSAVVRQVQRAGLAERVVFTGYCDDTLLTTLMAACQAVYFPSLFEGYGLPPLEAMAAGRPVVCSRIPSLEEIVGSAAITFDPTDVDSIVIALRRLASGGPEVSRGIALGKERANTIGSSRGMASRYAATFRSVLETRGGSATLRKRAS